MTRLKNLWFLFLRLLLKPVPHEVKKKIRMDLNFKRILEKNFPQGSDFSFIQVGGMDGVQFDILFDFVTTRKTTGIIFEPLVDFFAQLKKNYSPMPGIKTRNLALHPTEKEVTIYRVHPQYLSQLPEWAAGISSLLPDHHEKLGIDKKYIQPVRCEADHLMSALENDAYLKEPDLLQSDAEGFDHEIIRMIDFSRLCPSVIKFEFVNLEKGQLRETISILKRAGYFCFYEFPDVIAVRLSKIQL